MAPVSAASYRDVAATGSHLSIASMYVFTHGGASRAGWWLVGGWVGYIEAGRQGGPGTLGARLLTERGVPRAGACSADWQGRARS